MMKHSKFSLTFLSIVLLASSAWAIPAFVEHVPSNSVFGEPGGTTSRRPQTPRDAEAVDLWVKIGYSFFYNDVAIYYTVDGSTPAGSRGVGSGSTQVLRSSSSQVSFVRNEGSPQGNQDWWRATLPASTRTAGTRVRYIIGAWASTGIEVFANNYGCEDGVCNNPSNTPVVYEFTTKVAWPGAGAGQPSPNVGYPPVSFWKEEAVVGNQYCNVMLDQNGTLYDMYHPGPGCVYGVGTKNEGYVGGIDTFPPGLPLGNRGQMHYNQLMAGIRVDGTTHWLSNPNGVSFSNVTQSYVPQTNVVQTQSRLTAGGNNILVQQYDFSPYGINFPTDQGGTPNRSIYIKRFLLTNQGAIAKNLTFYVYGDWAINGGDSFDDSYVDGSRGAMVAYDNTFRTTNSSGEYNPTTTGDYVKNVSVYLGTALKLVDTVGGANGSKATDFWRDTSSDSGQGWMAVQVTLNPGQTREINQLVAGGFDNFANASGTYSFQIVPVIDWFMGQNMSSMQTTTENTWRGWLNQGVTVDFPDDRYDDLFERGLLASALHIDGKNGGIIAGMHNGAYPFVWPRDAVYAAVTLSRVGHFDDARNAYKFLRETAFRANEPWGKGFFYQKYTTDGYIVWSAPQVDETAVLPWGLWYLYQSAGNFNDLSTNFAMVKDSARASSEDSTLDSRLYYDDTFNLMYSMNVWEDSFDLFLYSNASVYRGLKDAEKIAIAVEGAGANSNLYSSRANSILNGIRGRLAWNGENTDISLLGLVYPFNVISPVDTDAVRVIDRINGVAGNNNGSIRPLVRFNGEWQGLIDRYWGDTYWNGGPWFLSTLWYGLYYADRADFTPGAGDISVHKSKIDLLIDRLGPAGFGAEQIAPSNSLMYPGQPDFVLQTAWPNVWESMSKFVDSIMAFLDWTPDAQSNVLRIAPKLPTGWKEMNFKNLKFRDKAFDIKVQESPKWVQTTLTNKTVQGTAFDVYLKLPTNTTAAWATLNGNPISFTYDAAGHRVRIQGTGASGLSATSQIRIFYRGNR